MSTYYNEIDPYCCQWLRNLIAEGLIAPGDVDERDIRDVKASDLDGYTQCHFFAGIAGWSYALRLAGWPDDRPVWTGSCPCQPFSAAGKRQGAKDDRHLWPEFRRLIAERNPATVFGEQVASRLGREWLAAVRSGLEALGYAVGAADLCAAGVGAPHIRQRLWFVAVADGGHSGTEGLQRSGEHGCESQDGGLGELADAMPAGRPEGRAGTRNGSATGGSSDIGEADADHAERGAERQIDAAAYRRDGLGGCGNTNPWSDLIWLPCTDGKQRPTQPGLFPLAHGVPARVAKLRAAGNAIVPQAAAEFVKACSEC